MGPCSSRSPCIARISMPVKSRQRCCCSNCSNSLAARVRVTLVAINALASLLDSGSRAQACSNPASFLASRSCSHSTVAVLSSLLVNASPCRRSTVLRMLPPWVSRSGSRADMFGGWPVASATRAIIAWSSADNFCSSVDNNWLRKPSTA